MAIAKTAKNIQSEVAIVSFTIDKPWFVSKLALLLYTIILTIIIYGIIKIREGYILNKKNSELARINKKLEIANDELESLSTRDALTGLYNRRFFDIEIEDKLNMAKRSRTYLTLLMIDIDYFKTINDNHGHLIGDKFLTDISKIILDILPRSTDTVSRYGGDEFAVILYDTDENGALKIANDINRALDKVTENVELTSLEVKTTVSMGIVSVVPKYDLTSTMLIQEADNTLYRAKQEGRNRICAGNID